MWAERGHPLPRSLACFKGRPRGLRRRLQRGCSGAGKPRRPSQHGPRSGTLITQSALAGSRVPPIPGRRLGLRTPRLRGRRRWEGRGAGTQSAAAGSRRGCQPGATCLLPGGAPVPVPATGDTRWGSVLNRVIRLPTVLSRDALQRGPQAGGPPWTDSPPGHPRPPAAGVSCRESSSAERKLEPGRSGRGLWSAAGGSPPRDRGSAVGGAAGHFALHPPQLCFGRWQFFPPEGWMDANVKNGCYNAIRERHIIVRGF